MTEKFCVSADIGLFCTSRVLREVYGEHVASVEEIAWPWCAWLLQDAQNHNLPVRRIHGRLGKPLGTRSLEGWMKVTAVNPVLLSTHNVINLACRYGINHVLLHTTEADASFNQILNAPANITFWIENDISLTSGLGAALDVVKALIIRGRAAGLTGDVGHFGLKYGILDDPNTTMNLFLQEMARLKGQTAKRAE